MSKKVILAGAAVFVLVFSSGVFTRMALPQDVASAAASVCSSGNFISDYFSCLKNDTVTVLAFFIFSQTSVLLPVNFALAAYKTYALGFTAAHITVSQGALLCFAMLLPGSIAKIPVYGYLLLVGFDSFCSPGLKKYLLCLVILFSASFVEVSLMHAVI